MCKVVHPDAPRRQDHRRLRDRKISKLRNASSLPNPLANSYRSLSHSFTLGLSMGEVVLCCVVPESWDLATLTDGTVAHFTPSWNPCAHTERKRFPSKQLYAFWPLHPRVRGRTGTSHACSRRPTPRPWSRRAFTVDRSKGLTQMEIDRKPCKYEE